MLRTRFANDDLAVELRAPATKRLRKRFEAEAANASKTTFLANMSHELRTPLNAILGFSDIIANETLGAMSIDALSRIRRATSTLRARICSASSTIFSISPRSNPARWKSSRSDLDPARAIENVSRLIVHGRARERTRA